MDDERRADDRDTAEHSGGTRAVISAGDSIGVVCGPDLFEDDEAFCIGCEFVRLLSPHGVGYCQVHGDIDGRENDPYNHVGEDI